MADMLYVLEEIIHERKEKPREREFIPPACL